MIGLVQVGSQAMADRYTYIPLIGIFIAVVWGIRAMFRRIDMNPSLQAATGLAVLATLAFLSWLQTGYWQNS